MQDWIADLTEDDLPESHRKFAEAIGIEATMRLCEMFGGSTIYIPKNDGVYNTVIRNREIIRRYLLGVKISRLSGQYGLSEQSILRIVRGHAPNQISVFDQ